MEVDINPININTGCTVVVLKNLQRIQHQRYHREGKICEAKKRAEVRNAIVSALMTEIKNEERLKQQYKIDLKSLKMLIKGKTHTLMPMEMLKLSNLKSL